MAKTRKAATKTGSTKKASGGKKKSAGATKKAPVRKPRGSAGKPKELNLRPLKRQLKQHVDLLSRARTTDQRVQSALASLRRLQAELNESCDPTMTIPLA